MTRYQALKVLASRMKDEICIVSLGGIVDEWFDARPHPREASLYLMALGCHMPLAFGVAVGLPHRTVVCLETDGSVLMNLGILATLGNEQPQNLKIFVFDNEMYECIGGPPTHTSGRVDLAAMARGAGISEARTVRAEGELGEAADEAFKTEGFHFVVAKIQPGVEEGLPRKKYDGIEDKYRFVRYLEDTEGTVILPPSQHN